MGSRNRRRMDDLLEDEIGHRLGHSIDLMSYHIEDATYASFDKDRPHQLSPARLK